ncbi:hypothetical protein QBC34DRAFT_145161 [Podospora aff. communis PSN243]|uniref:Mid2 domain-containing protein n=1 Tax=Podospora aff. communis PSN243 TaxID=3040156 RepID=A0AAV9GFX2_9PEZI|nr:hypothetical protein QBC34DRAFT_145161 [Podospora aff. communis PSN243]
MRIFTVLATAGLAVSTAAKITFINPPQFTRQIKATEHDVWVTGQTIDLRWSQPDKGKKMSVVLYQMNSTMAANYNGQFPGQDPPFEFITHDQIDATFFRWIVGTTKDLRVSNQFVLAVWVEGTVVTDSATDIFNITSAATVPESTSSATTGSGSSQTSPIATPLVTAESSSQGLSAGASAGIGVGAAIGAIALAVGAWFLIRRRRREGPAPPAPEYREPETIPHGGHATGQLEKVTYYHQSPSPNYTPSVAHSTELGVQNRAEMAPGGTRHELS